MVIQLTAKKSLKQLRISSFVTNSRTCLCSFESVGHFLKGKKLINSFPRQIQ